MMASRANDEHILHHVSDPWRVSSLMRAFFELILALCIFLCAIMYMTTTWLIKSSGLFNQSCASCDHHHKHRRQGTDLKGYQKLADSCVLPGTHSNFGGRYGGAPTSVMNIIDEDCTHFLSDCVCNLKRGSADDSGPGKFRCHGVKGDKFIGNNNSVNYCGSDHTIIWATDDDTTDSYRRTQRRGWSCRRSLQNIESSFDNGSSEPTVVNRTSVASADGCECQRCMGIPSAGGCSPLSKRGTSRILKRKFAKVSPNDNSNMARGDEGFCASCSCGHHSPNVFADSVSLIISEGGPSEIRESVGDSNDDGLQLMRKDGSWNRSLSDGGATQNLTVDVENSARDSSQESFSYSNARSRSSHKASSSRYADVSRNRLKLSIDSDFLAGESSTPEWCRNLASFSPSPAVRNKKAMELDMEEDLTETWSTVHHEQDPEVFVMELREALHEEQEALAALYLELEEERSAASSAAHEAMAMITRLQEEKAGIQMEARQYQRMAEEKHEYDQESMAMLQEILVKRDEELYALEEEVNKYRKRFLALGMDELMDRSTGGRERIGSPRSGDVLLIERETLLLEGSQDWKIRMDRRDEKLLAEIKDWLHEASEKAIVPREEMEELTVLRRNFPKLSDNINRLLPGNGKRNLFESFSSAAVPQHDGSVDSEDIQRVGIVNIEFEAQRDTLTNEEHEAHSERTTNDEVGTNTRESGAGYESFRGMMESLRQEPSLKDEESLETLKKIEEKFRRQSSQGEIRRSGDELRQIWKNILRSFESDEPEYSEACAVEAEAEARQSPTSAVEPANSSDSSHHHSEVTDIAVDADRSIGEKRISVLEYVSKFEEQLHQLGNKKPPIQPTKSGLSPLVEFVAESASESNGASSEFMDSSKNSTFGGDRPIIPTKTRLRKRRAADLRNATPDAESDRCVVRGEGFPSSEKATRNSVARFDKSPDFEDNNQAGSSVVHDVYEVQQDPRETVTENSSSHHREDKRFNLDIKKYVSSTVTELVTGQFVDSNETAVEQYLFDDEGLDFVALEEHEANGKGRPDQYCSTGSVKHSLKEPEMCTQAAELLPGEYGALLRESDGCAFQSPYSVVMDSPRTQMQDVVQQLTTRLKTLETDRQILQDTIASLQRGNGETKILQDISQQRRELQGIEQTAETNTNMWSADDPGFVSSVKGMLSWDKLRHSVQSQFSKLVHLFLVNGDPGGSQGDQQVGLFRLLHKSPLSKQRRSIERASFLKAVHAANSNPSDDKVQLFISTPNPLVSQYRWPINAEERSDTAFSGWDY